MMKGQYSKNQKAISDLQIAIERNKSSQAEAKARLNVTDQAIADLEKRLKNLLIQSVDKRKIVPLEKQLAHHRDVIRRRDELHLAALQEELPKLEAQLHDAEETRKDLISRLGANWLSNECNTYDSLARQLINCGKRLQAAHTILADSDRKDTFQKTVGPAFKYINMANIPVINNFDPSIFLHRGQYHAGMQVIDGVFEEITGEKQ